MAGTKIDKLEAHQCKNCWAFLMSISLPILASRMIAFARKRSLSLMEGSSSSISSICFRVCLSKLALSLSPAR